MLKNIGIKILAGFVLLLGRIFRRSRRIDPDMIRSVLINRTDRIGDAIASLPLILELSKRFKVTVLTSDYNEAVLKDIVNTRLISDARKTKRPEYDLYLDLVGISGLPNFLKIKRLGLCRRHIGFSLGPWNLLLDYSLNQNPVLFSKRHILDSYRLLIKNGLGLEIGIPDYTDLDKYLIKPEGFATTAPYILVNISGGDKFRGPGLEGYRRIIEGLDFNGKIVVMDGLGRPGMPNLKNCLKRKNICYLEKDYPLWELGHIAKGALLYIGSDSGITQLLSGLTNSLLFFGNGSSRAWSPYSKNPYYAKKAAGITIEETRNSLGLIKKIAYLSVWCRPCFDIGCKGATCVNKLDNIAVLKEINNTLRALN